MIRSLHESTQKISHEHALCYAAVLPGDRASFFNGGVPSASPLNVELFCSALRFLPASLDSNEGDREGDFEGDFELLNFEGGWFSREIDSNGADDRASGVPDRLRVVVRKRAARLLVDVIASA